MPGVECISCGAHGGDARLGIEQIDVGPVLVVAAQVLAQQPQPEVPREHPRPGAVAARVDRFAVIDSGVEDGGSRARCRGSTSDG